MKHRRVTLVGGRVYRSHLELRLHCSHTTLSLTHQLIHAEYAFYAAWLSADTKGLLAIFFFVFITKLQKYQIILLSDKGTYMQITYTLTVKRYSENTSKPLSSVIIIIIIIIIIV